MPNPNNFLTIKSKQLLLFVWMLSSNFFKLNSSHDARATRDINRTKIVFYTFGIHNFGAAYINRGIIMKKSCSEEEIRQKSCFQIRQNMIYYTNRVLLVLINGENTIFARLKHDFSTICFETFSFGYNQGQTQLPGPSPSWSGHKEFCMRV